MTNDERAAFEAEFGEGNDLIAFCESFPNRYSLAEHVWQAATAAEREEWLPIAVAAYRYRSALESETDYDLGALESGLRELIDLQARRCSEFRREVVRVDAAINARGGEK